MSAIDLGPFHRPLDPDGPKDSPKNEYQILRVHTSKGFCPPKSKGLYPAKTRGWTAEKHKKMAPEKAFEDSRGKSPYSSGVFP